MEEHPTITALRATALHPNSPLSWVAELERRGGVKDANGAPVCNTYCIADAAHIAAAVNAAPHLLAEVDRLLAELADVRKSLLPDSDAGWPLVEVARAMFAERAEGAAMRFSLRTKNDALRAQLEALASLIKRWPICPHWQDCATLTRGGDCTCGAVEADLARAEARKLLGVEDA